MQRLSISKGHAFILVYSVCSRQSLEELRPIWEVIRELKGPDLSQIPIMLVGNKCDESAELREVGGTVFFFVNKIENPQLHIGIKKLMSCVFMQMK
jgi:GTPase SAR1 family protein